MKRILNYIFFFLFSVGCSSEKALNVNNLIKEPVDETVLAIFITNEPENLAPYSVTTNNGMTSITDRDIRFGLTANPDYEGDITRAGTVKSPGEFEVNLANLLEGTLYYARAYAKKETHIAYGNEINFTTTFAESPLISIGEKQISGAHDIFISINLDQTRAAEFEEVGLVYSLDKNPSLKDKIVKRDVINTSFTERISDLKENTSYFIRPFAKTSKRIVYGDEVVVKTLTKGKFTYFFNGYDTANENHIRIKEAFDTATDYYNRFTSIVKHVVVNFSPGTPTADANFAGTIRVGANERYQRTGTAMHEMAHTVGVGQHWKWNDLIKSGVYQGVEANAILQMMTNNNTATVRGDEIHFWPYGINGAHEDYGNDMTYIIHALLIQGMKKDGLPSN
tara:strand:+ start:1510 stop:2691 length:1182 start_codon:yes stop_codon:yes gene_type:complete